MSEEEEEDLNQVPRRLRRYYRKGELPPEEMQARQDVLKGEMKKKSAEVAQREIKRFRERFKRFPKNGEFDDIAENVYTQVKTQSNEEQQGHGRFRHLKPGEIPSGKKVADLKKQEIEAKKSPGEKSLAKSLTFKSC